MKKTRNMQNVSSQSPVNSHNEWDLLEEVIAGVVDNANFPSWNTINEVTVRPGEWQQLAQQIAGKEGNPYPKDFVEAGKKGLKKFIAILESEGVTVRRPDVLDHALPYSTPAWQVSSGFCSANPRDVFLVIGNEIIEAPMADRGRYFES